jgi:F420-dependent oxidoreductase-like protein
MAKISFGVILPQGWLNDLPNANPYKQFELAKDVAQKAENLGFNSVWVYDHFFPYYAYKPLETKPMFECWTMLSAIAGITKKVRIGQVVTCNSYRSPALLAKMGATLDAISNGRLDFGIGAGWYEEEYKAYGYEYPKDSTRIAQLDEALQIIRSMWTCEKATFSGKHYDIRDAICNPKPMQKPYPPIMVGGTGEKLLLRVAAKHANRYNHPFGTPSELKRKIQVLKEHCKVIGRDHKEIETSVLIRVIVGRDDKEVRRIIGKVKLPEETVEQYLERTDGKTAVGTPEQVIADLNKYTDLGISNFILHFIGLEPTLKMLQLFASKVMKKV